ELPFKWLALHSDIPFQVAGKLPIVAADLACALLITAAVRAQGRSEWIVAGAAGAFFLNPLVLYNSAYYGRFDSLGCALLLAALIGLSRRHPVQWRSAGYYALAVAAKTFPVLVLAAVLRSARDARYRIWVMLAAVLVVLTLPYFGTPRALYTDIFRYDATKAPQGLSWQRELLVPLGIDQAKQLSYLLLICFAVVAVLLALTTELWLCTALTLVAFLLFSKVVLEQYLVWPLPFLLVVAGGTGAAALAAACLVLAGLLTTVGMLDNATYHPLELLAVMPYSLAAICLIGLVVGVTMRRAGRVC
ncbi:MAG: DUF2029 domain-containing protein, partial [Mycobacterium sp.]|nr:DUF2029 domain-containing protein [Mycobacterium sp.]